VPTGSRRSGRAALRFLITSNRGLLRYWWVVSVRIRHLFISPGHNYFGHHGEPPGEHPIVEVPEVRCVAGRGLEGVRFFDFKEDYKGQATFFAWETYERLCKELNVHDRGPGVFRRNIVVEGLDLVALVGVEFEVQGVRFLGTKQATPCYWMDTAFGPGAEAAMENAGGLRVKILTDGVLRAEKS
jgi:hypothetical protein